MDSDIPTEDRNLRLDMVMQEVSMERFGIECTYR